MSKAILRPIYGILEMNKYLRYFLGVSFGLGYLLTGLMVVHLGWLTKLKQQSCAHIV